MKLGYKSRLILLLLIPSSAFFLNGKLPDSKLIQPEKDRLIILDPVHPHGAQLQNSLKNYVGQDVFVYAPNDKDLTENYTNLINRYNKANTTNTLWKIQTYLGSDFLEKLVKDKKGNTVIIASSNEKKPDYILKVATAGLNMLVDKPMVLTPDDFKNLARSFQIAEKNNRYITDIPTMTMRNQINYILQKELAAIPELYGIQEKGSLKEPAIYQENLHHYLKSVLRPGSFFDVQKQGLGVADVTTHLIDLVQWTSFSSINLNYAKDINVLSSNVWATTLTPSQFTKATKLPGYPKFLEKDIQDSLLRVYSNGEINYTIKNIHTRIVSKWNYQAKPGEGDTYQSFMKGSKSSLMIQPGKPNDLYIKPKPGIDLKAFESVLAKHFDQLQKKYAGIELFKEEGIWRIHSSKRALGKSNSLTPPSSWERNGMLAKYYTTTQAVAKVKFRD